MKTHCKYGHPFSGENLYTFPDGRRACRVCRTRVATIWTRKHPERAKVAKAAYRLSPKGLKAKADGHLQYSYGLTADQRDKKFQDQGNVCKICKRLCKPCVDHNHACCSGKRSCGRCLRDILCSRCNTVLGRTKDDVTLLLTMVDYLRGWQSGIQDNLTRSD